MKTNGARYLFLITLSVALLFIAARGWVASLLLNGAHIQVLRPVVQVHDIFGSACEAQLLDATLAHFFLQHAFALEPASMQNEWWLGNLDWLEGNCDAALAHWQASANQDSTWSQRSGISLARGLLAMGRRAQAVPVLRRAGLEPYLYQQAYQREVAQDYPAAIDYYQLAMDTQPTYDAASRLAQLYQLQNNPTAERTLWINTLAIAPDDDVMHQVALAHMAALDNDWDAAITAYNQAARMTHDQTIQFDMYLRLGRSLLAVKQTDRAMTAYEKAIGISTSSSSEPYTTIAEIQMQRGDNAAASEWYRRALALFPRDPWAYLHTANFEEKLGHPEEARRLYSTALQVTPESYVTVYLMWGLFEYRLGNSQTAIDYLERANVPVPNCTVSVSLQQIYQATGDQARYQSLTRTLADHCSHQ
jgi:tetratricopeptide (TPR) repeat protein